MSGGSPDPVLSDTPLSDFTECLNTRPREGLLDFIPLPGLVTRSLIRSWAVSKYRISLDTLDMVTPAATLTSNNQDSGTCQDSDEYQVTKYTLLLHRLSNDFILVLIWCDNCGRPGTYYIRSVRMSNARSVLVMRDTSEEISQS